MFNNIAGIKYKAKCSVASAKWLYEDITKKKCPLTDKEVAQIIRENPGATKYSSMEDAAGAIMDRVAKMEN